MCNIYVYIYIYVIIVHIYIYVCVCYHYIYIYVMADTAYTPCLYQSKVYEAYKHPGPPQASSVQDL